MAKIVEKTKIIRCPVHDLIKVDTEFSLEIINSKPMQRLRRVRQLGLAYLVYPGAEHSRFAHSVGVYHLANRFMDALNLSRDKQAFDDKTKAAVRAAALLHDVGHGAFSHLFELVTKDILKNNAVDHEQWTEQVIKEDPAISNILMQASQRYGTNMSADVLSIINHTHKKKYVSDLVSSQLDVDRFDYLLRDSLMTGVHYGNFDLEWIIRSLKIREYDGKEVLAVDAKRGLSSIESYILGRHYMYCHVYYHKTIRAAEIMLRQILKRAVYLAGNGQREIKKLPVIGKLGNKEQPEISEYLSLNDFVVYSWIEKWADESKDKILRDLSNKLICRQLFKTIPVNINKDFVNKLQQMQEKAKKAKLDPEYYCCEDEPKNVAFKDYFYDVKAGNKKEHQDIFLVNDKGVEELSYSDSFIIEAKRALKFQEYRIYVPREIET